MGPSGSLEVTVKLPAGSRVEAKSAACELRGLGRLGDVSFDGAYRQVKIDEAGSLRLAAVDVLFHEVAFPFRWRPPTHAILATAHWVMAWLVAGEHSLGVEAFFCRQPDENHEAFYRFLLERNGRMYGVHFTLDETGDVYLTGKLPLSSVSEDDIDRLLG